MLDLLSVFPDWLRSLLLVTLALVSGLAAHALLTVLLARGAAHSRTAVDDIVLTRLRAPVRLLFVVMAISVIQPLLADWPVHVWLRVAGLLVPALVGWVVIALLGAALDLVNARADLGAADNLRARRRRTRAIILYRIGLFLVLLVTFCMMLMSIPSVRSIGVTLIASAGLAALAVGAAAQPALKNLIAGLQLAFTEPIRIDDVVIIDGEWGRIEQIGLTFVVVKLWDERRLVVPLARFLEQSFENWTRETSQLLGAVLLHVDPTADVPAIRARLEAVTRANDKWDGRVVGLQVTDMHPDHIELRALVSASDAGRLFDLRCEIREAMIAFLTTEMPSALPRRRQSTIPVSAPQEVAATEA